MEQTIKLFLEIVKAEVTGQDVPSEIIKQLTPEVIGELYQIANKHDLAHIVAIVLQKHHLLGGGYFTERYEEALYLALIRYENIQHELQHICNLFEKNGIAYIPLKGAVIRQYYAEPWQRTSCDIDILVTPEDLDRACMLLTMDLQYAQTSHDYKDVSLYSPSGVHLELHFMIKEKTEAIDGLLGKVWEYAHPKANGGYCYEMETEFFLFHLFAHISYHFAGGGCGVRFLVDIWLLFSQMQYDKIRFKELCLESGIWEFVERIHKLIRVWFEGESHDAISEEMETYIIHQGIYGTASSTMLAHRTRTGGKFSYLLKRICMPYVDLCVLYPKLKKYRILYPFYTLARWGTVLKPDVLKRVVGEAQLNRRTESKSVDERREFLRKVGL